MSEGSGSGEKQSLSFLRRASNVLSTFSRVRSLDRFGFFLDDGGDGVEGEGSLGDQHVVRRKMKIEHIRLENIRTQKWLEMLKDWDRLIISQPDLIKKRLRKGVPSALRVIVWPKLCGGNKKVSGLFASLLKQRPARADEVCISLDLPRTYPNHFLFANRPGRGSSSSSIASDRASLPASEASSLRPDDQLAFGQSALRNVLRAYAVHDPAVGYCQGMAFVAGLLVIIMKEEDAFFTLVGLLDGPKYELSGMYAPGLPRFTEVMHIFNTLCREIVPKLAAHFDTFGVDHAMYASQWFMTLFSYSFPFDVVMRVWDMFLFEGWKVVYRVALAVLKLSERELLLMDFEELMPALKALSTRYSPNVIIRQSLAIPLSRHRIELLSQEYRKVHADEIKKKIDTAVADAVRKEKMLADAEAARDAAIKAAAAEGIKVAENNTKQEAILSQENTSQSSSSSSSSSQKVQVSYHDENIPHHVNFELLHQTNNRERCEENGIQSIASEEYYEAIRSLKGVSITVAFNGKTDVLEQGTSEFISNERPVPSNKEDNE
jgi:TBC1 domain family member 10